MGQICGFIRTHKIQKGIQFQEASPSDHHRGALLPGYPLGAPPQTPVIGSSSALARGGSRNFHLGRPVKRPSKFWVGQQELCTMGIMGMTCAVWVDQTRVRVGHGLHGLIARTASVQL